MITSPTRVAGARLTDNAFSPRTGSALAQQLQRDRVSAHPPAANSYFNIPQPGSHHRSQRIAKAAI